MVIHIRFMVQLKQELNGNVICIAIRMKDAHASSLHQQILVHQTHQFIPILKQQLSTIILLIQLYKRKIFLLQS